MTSPPATAQAEDNDLDDLDGLTIAAFAAAMKVCERTVERGIRAGKFPVVTIAGKRRIPGPWARALLADAVTTGRVIAEDHGQAWIANQAAKAS